jgi:hypothetical protein
MTPLRQSDHRIRMWIRSDTPGVRASCVCGWTGPAQPDAYTARGDYVAHLARAAPNPREDTT